MEDMELLPCPFCGGSADVHEIDEPENSPNYGGRVIGCLKCGACTAIVFVDKVTIEDSRLPVLWNARVTTDAPDKP